MVGSGHEVNFTIDSAVNMVFQWECVQGFIMVCMESVYIRFIVTRCFYKLKKGMAMTH